MLKKVFIVILIPLFSIAQTNSFDRGVALYDAERFQAAKPHFESHLKENPNDLQTIEFLGDIAAYASDWDKAIHYYKILVERNPNNANYNFKYGGVLGRKAQSINRFRAALLISDIKKHLEKAAELDPYHKEVHWALVDLYMALPSIVGGSETTARKYANQLLKISELDGYLILGRIAENFNKHQDAEKYYKKALDLSVNTKINHNQNSINYHVGKLSGMYNVELNSGLDHLNAFIQNHSVKDGIPIEWAYFRKAQIYRHLSQKNQAEKWINKALSVKRDFKEAREEKMLIGNL
jgi:tetratricopeptide (TPR) repeat protein